MSVLEFNKINNFKYQNILIAVTSALFSRGWYKDAKENEKKTTEKDNRIPLLVQPIMEITIFIGYNFFCISLFLGETIRGIFIS